VAILPFVFEDEDDVIDLFIRLLSSFEVSVVRLDSHRIKATRYLSAFDKNQFDLGVLGRRSVSTRSNHPAPCTRIIGAS
jgi:hypothetical protein